MAVIGGVFRAEGKRRSVPARSLNLTTSNNRMKFKSITIGLAGAGLLLAGQAFATVTNTAWYHLGEGGIAVQTDATGSNTFNAAYFQCTAPLVGPNAAGGPLGASAYTSTNSARFGLNGCITEFYRSGVSDGTNFYVPPPTNFGIEMWFMPQNRGFVSDGSQSAFTPVFASGGSIFGAGPGGGVAVLVVDNFDGTSSLQAAVVHQGDSAGAYSYFGPNILIDTNNWIHLALVNDNGLLTFYTNGVVCATNDNNSNPQTASAGTLFIGRDGGHVSIDGFLDEARVFIFAPGAFSTNDLLYHTSPRAITVPPNTTVWNGGAANVPANISIDTANTYQWYQGSTALGGQTSANLNLNTVALVDSGNTYKCAVTNNGNGLVTSNATLTVVPAQTANAAAYQSTIAAESGLLAYFTVDGSTTATVVNTVDGAHNGTLEAGALYDGQTNRAFGVRSIFLRETGDVKIPTNPAYEFSANGTIEALVYLRQTLNGNSATIFSVASDDGTAVRYSFAAAGDGSTLILTNDSGVNLTWPVASSLLNRLAHVALVFSGTTSVTAYADGQSLGTKTQSGFGSASGVPAWIGSATTNSHTLWNGALDEMAVYSTALSATTIAIHNSKFIFGTNTSAPVIVSQSSSKTVYVGGSPVLSVSVSGTPPLSYQWRSNGLAISGAVNSTLALSNVGTNATAAYTVSIINSFGSTNNNSNPINLTVVNAPDTYSKAVMNDHPTAFWRLNESSGTNMSDYAGELDGTYSGTLTLGAPGIISDPAVLFGGGLGSVPYSSLLNPSGPFTVEFWGRPAAAASGTAVAAQNRAAGRLGYVVYNNFNGQGWEVDLGNAVTVNVFLIGATRVVGGTWYHVAFTYDGGANATLYVYGYPDATSSNAGGGNFVPNATVPFQIGLRTSGGAFPFNGTLDEVAFYNYALSQAQLQNHVSTGMPIKLAITASSNVVADTKPAGPLYDGFNNGGTWLASASDGTTTRSGVMQFTATNSTGQVTDFGYSSLGTTNGTVMFWMRSAGTTGGGNEGAILFDWRSSVGLAMAQYDNNTIFIQAQNNFNHFNSVATVSDNKWHHIAITYDQTALGGVSLYIDSSLDSSAFNQNAWSWPVGQVLEIGRDTLYDGGYWRNFDGQMDDFRMYNRILTQSEVAAAAGGSVVDSSALQLRLNFDSPPGGYQVAYPYGSLQSAPAVTGAYTTISNINSPFPVAPKSAPQKYFRGLR